MRVPVDSRGDLALSAGVMAWIAAILLVDSLDALVFVEALRQVLLGVGTWALLGALLWRETPLVRTQTLLVVVFATAVEYTFSPLLEAYTYRIETVPPYVPPGHGLVYLAALALGRSGIARRNAGVLVAATVAAGGAWAGYGLVVADRQDVLGAFWFACLLAFLVWGRSRMLYVGAFLVVSWLELIGTAVGTWAWAPVDPVLGVVTQGNPPSGAAGGYGWFDLYAMLLAPRVLAVAGRLRAPIRPVTIRSVTIRPVTIRSVTIRPVTIRSVTIRSVADPVENLVVHQPVGRQRIAAEGAVTAVE